MRAIVLLLAAALCCGSVHAAVPHEINYQGYLTSPGGAPVNASVAMVLNLYLHPTGGAVLYTETQTVTVTNGVFNVLIGSVTTLALPFDVLYYLGIKVGADPEMTPRQAVVASPYAIRAASADTLASGATVTGSQIADGTVAASKLAPNGCTSGQILKYNGSGWACAADDTGVPAGGAVGQVLVGTGGVPAWGSSPVISGNVSVGSVSAAAARLDVSGSGWFRADANGLSAGAAQGVRVFYDTFSGSGNMYAYDYAALSPLNLTLQSPGGNVAIGNTIPTSKLTVAGPIESTSGGVKFPDSSVQLTAMRKAQNVLVVAKSGGDFATISAALTSITDNTASNRYVIYVGPGTYAEQVTMKQHVDIQGAGELATTITGVGNVSSQTGTVLGASNAEMRFLTVENTGGNSYAIAIFNNAAAPRLSHVAANAFGGGNLSAGVLNSASSSPTMNDVTASATGSTAGTINAGVYNSDSSPTISNSVISASGGSVNWGISNSGSAPGSYTVLVNHSRIVAATSTVANDYLFTTRIGASQLSGGPISTLFGTITCAGVYDEAYVFFANTCP